MAAQPFGRGMLSLSQILCVHTQKSSKAIHMADTVLRLSGACTHVRHAAGCRKTLLVVGWLVHRWLKPAININTANVIC
jgi:hypothetical protein